jgi:DNA-3-methyladenine glycosylase I
MSGYCDVARGHEWHGPYHDRLYGFPIGDDNELFERLILEINQAGLSWLTILKRQEAFRGAYHRFDVARVAGYRSRDVARLMNDAGIIRNRLKIEAAIENAGRIQRLPQGTFAAWLAHHHPLTRTEWVKLFRQTFRFTGGEIVGEFLMSIGSLPGAHRPDCPVFGKIARRSPPWMRAARSGFDYSPA